MKLFFAVHAESLLGVGFPQLCTLYGLKTWEAVDWEGNGHLGRRQKDYVHLFVQEDYTKDRDTIAQLRTWGVRFFG